MAGKILEAKAIISAEDRTGKAFDAIEARVTRLNKYMGGLGKQAGLVSKMSSYFGDGGGSALGRDFARERRAVDQASTAHRRHMSELAEAKKMRREVLGEGGGHLMGLGSGIAAGFAIHEAAKLSADRVHERVRMQVSGMSAGESRAAEQDAAKIAADFPAIGQTEIMHMLRNARSIVGSYKEAAEIMEPLVKLRVIAQAARPGQDVSEDFDQLVKGLEIKGVTQNPKQFHDYMEGIAKGLNVFGDTLKPYQYYEMFKYGRQATPGLSEDFILSTAPTLAQELGGSSYGNAVSGFNRAIVGGRMEHPAIKELARIGLIAHDDVDWLKTGEAKGIKSGRAVNGWQLAQSNPNEWVKQYLLPALAEHGVTDPSAIMKEIGTLFSNRMAAQLVSILATQQSRINKDRALYLHAPGTSAADDYMSKDPHMAYGGLKAALESAVATIGAGTASALTPSMNELAKAIAGYTARLTAMNAFRDEHPGEATLGQRKVNRILNRVEGIDSDAARGDVPMLDRLDVEYQRQRAKLAGLPGQKPPTKPKTPGYAAILRSAGGHHVVPGFEGTMAALDDYDSDGTWQARELAALDQAHEARVKAQRDLALFNRNLPTDMGFGAPHRAVVPYITAAMPGEGANGLAFPSSMRGGYGGYDVRTGMPATHAMPAVAQPAAAAQPDLAAMLAGKLEATVKPDQITAKMEGSADVNVKVEVGLSGESLRILSQAKAATSQGNVRANVGTSAPDTAAHANR